MKNKQFIINLFRDDCISQNLHPVRDVSSVEIDNAVTPLHPVRDATMLFDVACRRHALVVGERFSTELISLTGYSSRKFSITSCLFFIPKQCSNEVKSLIIRDVYGGVRLGKILSVKNNRQWWKKNQKKTGKNFFFKKKFLSLRPVKS